MTEGTWSFAVTLHGQDGFETTVRRQGVASAVEALEQLGDAVAALEEDQRIGQEVQRQMDANPDGSFAPWPYPGSGG